MVVGVCYQNAECTVYPGYYKVFFIKSITYLVPILSEDKRRNRLGYIIRFAIP